MSNKHSQNALNEQKAKVSGVSPKLKIIAPCTIGNGILKLSPPQQTFYEKIFDEISGALCFFIPASGSGSRMFDFLQVELSLGKKELAVKTNDFMNRLNEFAFYKFLNEKEKEQVLSFQSHEEVIAFILEGKNNGIGLGYLPKGLVPFHTYKDRNSSAFYEHLSQGISLTHKKVNFHFTIQDIHQDAFQKALFKFKSEYEIELEVDFSIQDPDTDAYVFDKHKCAQSHLFSQ